MMAGTITRAYPCCPASHACWPTPVSPISCPQVDGIKVHNLQHLAHLVDSARGDFIRFDLEWKKVSCRQGAWGVGRGRDSVCVHTLP